MTGAISTCNMAEALYLLKRGNHVVKIECVSTWPYGLEELAIFFEGETAEADHDRYIKRGIPVDLSGLTELFTAVSALLPAKGGVV